MSELQPRYHWVVPQAHPLDEATIEDAKLGPVAMQNVLFKMSETPGAIRHTGRSLGADTDSILQSELDLSTDELRSLRESGVIA